MELKTKLQVKRIVNSFSKVFKTGEIVNLNKQAYDFINLSSGFIAHYNLFGFRGYYSNVELFKREILDHRPYNQWRNFGPADRDYDYYMQKREIYNQICDLILERQYQAKVELSWA
jgi:hypothetical protein